MRSSGVKLARRRKPVAGGVDLFAAFSEADRTSAAYRRITRRISSSWYNEPLPLPGPLPG